MSTHNSAMATRAVKRGIVEMLLFIVNPAFDMRPSVDDLDVYFDWENYTEDLGGIDPQRMELYRLCGRHDVCLTVMKPFVGGRLFNAKRSPLCVALTPVQRVSTTVSPGPPWRR